MAKTGNSVCRARRRQLKKGTTRNLKRKKSVKSKAVARKAQAKAKK